MFEFFDRSKNGVITPDELRHGMRKKFGLRLKQWEIDELCKEEITIKNFSDIVSMCLSEFGSK